MFFGGYGLSCTLEMKNADGDPTLNASQAYTMNWTVSISKLRPDTIRNTYFTKIVYTAPTPDAAFTN